MADIADHMGVSARPLPAGDRAAPDAQPIALKARPLPSQRVSPAMPHAVCVRLVGAWIGALGLLLAVVLVVRASL